VKIDFMDRDDQEMVNWYEKITRCAAEHHLMVNFHGAYKPTGMIRTWPNQITREGILGNEYNKWSRRVTPEHRVTLPFTRFLAGPGDFTPGGFREPHGGAVPAAR
jgi:alpha-glucosidase